MKYSENKNSRYNFDGIVLLLIFCAACGQNVFALERQAGIEIIADGKKYDSIEDYRERQAAAARSRSKDGLAMQYVLNHVKRYVRYPLDVNPKAADIQQWVLGTAKTKEKQPSGNTYDPFLESYSLISRIGFNTGISKVIEDFQHDIQGKFSSKHLKPKDLESTLRQSFGGMDYTGPILIISHQKKLRIMTLETQETEREKEPVKVIELNR